MAMARTNVTLPEEMIREMVQAIVAVIARRMELYAYWYDGAMQLDSKQYGRELVERVESLVLQIMEARRAEIRPADLKLAATLSVEMPIHFLRLSAGRHRARIKSGDLAEEVAEVLIRYLMKDPPRAEAIS